MSEEFLDETEAYPYPEKGWWWPMNSKKAHYFVVGEFSSLCGKWGRLSEAPLEDSKHDSADNCAQCKRERVKRFGQNSDNLPGNRCPVPDNIPTQGTVEVLETQTDNPRRTGMKVGISKARKMYLALGFDTAKGWDETKLNTRLKKLDQEYDPEDPIEDEKLDNLAKKIVAALGDGKEVTVETDEAAAEKKSEPKAEAPAKAKTTAKAPKNEPVKKAAAKEKSTPKEERGPGVIDSIEELLREAGVKNKPLTKDELYEKLLKRFPDKKDSLRGTINTQVPSKMRSDRNITVLKNENRGYYIKPKKAKA